MVLVLLDVLLKELNSLFGLNAAKNKSNNMIKASNLNSNL